MGVGIKPVFGYLCGEYLLFAYLNVPLMIRIVLEARGGLDNPNSLLGSFARVHPINRQDEDLPIWDSIAARRLPVGPAT